MEPVKLWYITLFLFLVNCCQPAPTPPRSIGLSKGANQQKYPRRRISYSEMSLLKSQSEKKMDAITWHLIGSMADTLPEPIPVLHFITGNIDQDRELEIAIWYLLPGATGPIYFFDDKGDHWYLAGEDLVNFIHHDSAPPRYNPAKKAIEISQQHWGSGCIANAQSSIQIAGDSCVTILHFLKEEHSCCVMGTSVARKITATDRVQNDSTVVVSTNYRLYYLDDASEYNHKSIFEGQMNITYHWNRLKHQYIPDTLPELSAYVPCEHNFDAYFSRKIEQVKNNGPSWKRAALGNVE